MLPRSMLLAVTANDRGAIQPLEVVRGGPATRYAGPRFDLRCAECGHEVSVSVAPARCPTGHENAWRYVSTSAGRNGGRQRSTEEAP